MPRGIKTKRFTFRVTQSFLAEIQKAAKQDQRTLSDWILIKLSVVLAERQSQEKVA